MKYCANCGYKINNNQSFCNNCGAKLHDFQSNQQSNHNKIDKVRGVNNRYTYRYRDNNQHKRSGFGKVLIAILAVVILGLLVSGLYFAYHQFKVLMARHKVKVQIRQMIMLTALKLIFLVIHLTNHILKHLLKMAMQKYITV